MKLAVWSPLPPSASGIADYVSEQLGELRRHAEVVTVGGEASGAERPDVDLDVYHVGNSPSHTFVHRAALQKPGVVVLHDWSVHHLVLADTVERGDVAGYVREMRRAHGALGTFVARQVSRDLGGEMLPSLFPLNERLLESSLAVVALSRVVAERAARRLPGRPILHLPHHVCLPLVPLPGRDEARRELGLAQDALVVTAPGLATRSKRLNVALKVAARLRKKHERLHLVVAGGVEQRLPLEAWVRQAGMQDAVTVTGRLELDDFVRHLVAADVLLALRFPSHGEMSGALVRGLGVGRPVVVTAGTPAAEEFPEGVVVKVDPGPAEAATLEALLDRLLSDATLRDRIGRLASAHAAAELGIAATTARLAAFLEDVAGRREVLAAEVAAQRLPEQGLLGMLLGEVRRGVLDLGLGRVPASVVEPVAGLLEKRS